MTSAKFPKRNYAPRPRKDHAAARAAEQAAARAARPVRRERRGPDRQHAEQAPPPAPAADTAWEKQAGWYDQHQGERGDDFYTRLVLPAVLRQLAARPGQRVLDVCCGQGVLGRALADQQVACVGVDASPALVAAATARARPPESYRVGDARALGEVLPGERFDHAALVMALQDLDPIQPVLDGVAALVRPGGHVVIAMTHPVFRIPRRTTWGFDEDTGVQYRRLDGYLSPMKLPIRTHPGRPDDTSSTASFHRPLNAYLNACGQAGLGIVACEELCSHRRGTKGPRFGAEDRAAKEFPVFLVLTAVRLAGG
jgi:ubiquinone/menaquinone biosynthesis C-methylase UbiE